MILKLTEVRKDGDFPIWINFDHVQGFNTSMKGINGRHDTNIKLIGSRKEDNPNYYFVRETPEEIMLLLNGTFPINAKVASGEDYDKLFRAGPLAVRS